MPLGPLMLDVEGLELTPLEVETLGRPGVGGLILFRRNFESVGQVKALVSAIRAVRPDIIIAVDQEGGRVQRFQAGLTRLPALRVLGEAYERDSDGALTLAMDFGWLMAAEMLSLGVDISLHLYWILILVAVQSSVIAPYIETLRLLFKSLELTLQECRMQEWQLRESIFQVMVGSRRIPTWQYPLTDELSL